MVYSRSSEGSFAAGLINGYQKDLLGLARFTDGLIHDGQKDIFAAGLINGAQKDLWNWFIRGTRKDHLRLD